MSEVEGFGSVLMEFGARAGIRDLSLDESLRCRFVVDEKLNIDVYYNRDKDTFSLLSEIGPLSDNNFEICCNYLLKANGEWSLSRGMTLGKLPGTGVATLGYYESAVSLQIDRFIWVVKQFVEACQAWKGRLESMLQGQIPEELAKL
jgi:hypothetical protein